MSTSSTPAPAPTPKPFIPGSFIKLPDGTLRPLTPEEENRSDIDWPYREQFPYNQYRRRCMHCKGQLYARLLGHSTVNGNHRIYMCEFGVIVCLNRCDPPFKETERELKGAEWHKKNSRDVYYTQEEIEQFGGGHVNQ